MNDGNSGYPWSTGDVLLAADLNAAIANAAAIGTAAVGDTVSSDVRQAVGDYTTLAGPVSWSGVTVNIAGANFAPGDVGKYLIMPAGGTDPLDPVSQPAIVRITSANGTTANVDHTVAHAFSGLTNIVGGPNSTPWNIDVAAPGAGGSFIGDVLTLVAPAIRPAAVQVIQTQVLSATVVNSGSGGPVGAVLLRGTTGYGRRVVLSGTVDATGTLLPALMLDSATGADPGAYWFDVEDANAEPLRADPQKITYPARWNTIDPVITLDSGQVSSLVMPSIHVGALVFAVDDNNVVAYPPRTTVTHVDGPSLTATLSATATVGYGNSGPRNVDFNDNKHELTFPATFANNSTTIVATGTLPTGVVVGQLIYGPGLTGGNDPTDPAAGSTIQTIAGTTITISRPTTHAATAAVTLNTVPYLTGAVVKLNLVPAVLAFKDYGAYAGAPGSSGVPFATTRAGASTDITLLIDNPVRTTPVAVSFGTDNTSQINAWLADARNLMNANGGGIEAILRPGQYLALGSINARNLNQNGVTLRVSGVRIHSAAKGLRAWDASGAAAYRMVGDFVLNGDQLFPPDTGMVFAYSDTYLRCNGLSLRDITCTGWFSFASVICANAESFHVINMQSGNAMPWPVPVAPTDPNWHPTFGKVIDGDNSYNKLDAPAYQTHASFVGFLEDNGSSNCNGGAIPFSVVGCGGYTNRAGYAASWSAPAIFFSKTGHSILDIHCEVETLTDIVFLWDRNNGVVQFNNSRFDDNACEATNSVFSYDHFGKFGVHVAGFSGINSRVSVGLQHNSAQPFDDHSAFAGSHIWHGDIAVGGVLHTQTQHWVRNFPDDREGLLLLGDDKTNYNADAVNTSTLIVGNTIQANGDITSEAGLVNAALGVVIGVPGFPQGKLTFDGTNLSGTKPISLPAGSIAITPAPGNSSTSVATTAFVQAAASASLTYVATGGITPRTAQDHAGDRRTVRDFGAYLNGTLSDAAGIGAHLAALGTNEPLVMPPGAASVVWGSVQNTTPTFPVLFKTEGVMSGGSAMVQAFNRVGKGDLFESYSNGTKMLVIRSGKADAGGVLRIEHNQVLGGGTGGFVNNVLNIVCQDNTAAVTSMWGVNVSMDTYSNQAGWPQNVGGSFSQHKHGKAWAAGVHITADDDQNLPSSAGGPLLGLEMGFRANNVDDGFSGGVTGGIGIRMGLHLSLYEYGGTGAVLPGEISFGILADGSANSITKSILAVSTDMNTYQVVDARGALPPSGYTSPVAAVRMSAGQIVDFNGGAALNSVAGNYLQYTSTGTPRLRYMAGTTEAWSVSDTGAVSTGSSITVPLGGSIQAAHDALPSTGGTIVLSPGVYDITAATSPQISKPNVRLAASSWSTILRRNATYTTAGIVRTTSAATGFICEGFTVDGNSVVAIGPFEVGISGANSLVRNMQIINSAATGHLNLSGANSRATGNTIAGLGTSLSTQRGYGIWAISHATVMIDHNVISGTGIDGVGFDGQGTQVIGNTVSGCHCWTGGQGGQIASYYTSLGGVGNTSSIIGNFVGPPGSLTQGSGIESWVPGAIISGNSFDGIKAAAITVFGNGTTITGNSIRNCGGSVDAVVITANVTDFVISGNRVADDQVTPTMRAGIAIYAGTSDRFTITDNLITGWSTFAVWNLGTGTNRTITNNMGSAAAGIVSGNVTYLGTQQVGDGTGAAQIALASAATATPRGLIFHTGAVGANSERWNLTISSGAESGGNAGSSFNLGRWDDSGAFLALVWSVARATGLTTYTGAVQHNGQVGFNSTAPIAKPTVTGAKGSNAALASLMTALAAYGLITDSTSA